MPENCGGNKEKYTAQTLPVWEQWIRNLAESPCAAYVVKYDSTLALQAANESFYRLIACSENDMRIKYANCLSALLDGESLKLLNQVVKEHTEDNSKSMEVKQKIKRSGKQAWIQTEIVKYNVDSHEFLCCISFDITEYEQMRIQSRYKDEAMAIVSDQVGLGYFEYDLHKDVAYLYMDQTVLPDNLMDSNGICKNFVNRVIDSGIIQDGSESVFQEVFLDVKKGSKKAVCEVPMRDKKGGRVWIRVSLALKPEGRDSHKIAVGVLEDVTQQKEAARSYLNETQFYQATLVEKTAYGHVDVTEDRITRAGGMWNLYNEIIDKVSYSHLITEFINKVVHPEDRKHYLEIMQVDNFIQSLENGIDRLGCEFRRIVDQNKMMWMELEVHLFQDPLTHHVLALLMIKNIDEKKKQEFRRFHDEMLDPLTGVYHKRVAEDITIEHLAKISSDELCSFMILNVDNLNNTAEPEDYDNKNQMLVLFAKILRRAFRKNDVIGRHTNDQFAVFIRGLDGEERVKERLDSLYRDFARESIFCTTGVAFSRGSIPYRSLLYSAQKALEQAGEFGGNRVQYCEAVLCQNEVQVREWEDEVCVTDEALFEYPCVARSSVEQFGYNNVEFDGFLSEQGDIAYLVDLDTYELLSCNRAFYNRLGISEQECVGMKCFQALHKRETPCPFCSKANWPTDKFYMWKNMNQVLEQEFLIKNRIVTWNGREVMLALAIDISNDKSIVDSLENGATETHSILSGVQHMAEASTLDDAMNGALEAIGSFFRADAVRLWKWEPSAKNNHCIYMWSKKVQSLQNGSREINAWLEKHNWDRPVMLESPEAVLGKSFDMYTYMKNNNVQNQRWVRIREDDQDLGYISIENISSNFQNVAFLDSFTVFIASEMRKRILMERALYNGNHDELTGLLNRKCFEDFMEHYVPDDLACVGVTMANLNNLKGINSSRGFQTGNYYITLFAGFLRSVFEEKDIYRLNGDEFLTIIPEITRTELDDKIAALERIVIESGFISVAIGKAWDDVENDISMLISQATDALKLNKKRHYDSVPVALDQERRNMTSELVSCLENKEFEVFLQPKVNLLNNQLFGAEALIRYRHKELGVIPPVHFIDMLEKNNLIRYIDLFVLETVCRQLERWKHEGRFLPIVSLNFSRLTMLEQDILSSMEEIVSRYDVKKENIEIEITESIASMGKSVLYQTVCDLFNAGYSISLDDFGTKYTNLSILADLKFSVLKIDRSLVGKLGKQMSYRLIMKNIIQMCNDLGIEVIAEGIETEMQEKILRSLGCCLGQGYRYGRPMPIEEFEQKNLRI